ncbi:MAG TPA: vWA domain-containing protein [Chloroflexia bacterium]|nr:vWA domain-containing protein [Chloroflexia bacterium]
MSDRNVKDVQDLFSDAGAEGLNQAATTILVDNLDAVALAGCSGADLDEINTDDVTLVAAVIDASGSMAGVKKDVVAGFNTMLDTFRGSKQADSILLSTWSFNDKPQLHYSYTPVPLVADLTAQDYHADGGTALYDTLLYVMAGMVAYGQSLRNSGVRTRCIVVVFSDGADNTSRSHSFQVRSVSAGLLSQEIYTLAYAGFGGGSLQAIANEVGFPSIITASSTPSEIRRIFNQVSASVIRASQTRIGTSASSFFTI